MARTSGRSGSARPAAACSVAPWGRTPCTPTGRASSSGRPSAASPPWTRSCGSSAASGRATRTTSSPGIVTISATCSARGSASPSSQVRTTEGHSIVFFFWMATTCARCISQWHYVQFSSSKKHTVSSNWKEDCRLWFRWRFTFLLGKEWANLMSKCVNWTLQIKHVFATTEVLSKCMKLSAASSKTQLWSIRPSTTQTFSRLLEAVSLFSLPLWTWAQAHVWATGHCHLTRFLMHALKLTCETDVSQEQ